MELARKLSRYAEESDDVEALLDALEAAKYLSAERFSDSLVHRRSARFGNNRIIAELQSHGLPAEEIGRVKSELVESEAVRATEALHRKIPCGSRGPCRACKTGKIPAATRIFQSCDSGGNTRST